MAYLCWEFSNHTKNKYNSNQFIIPRWYLTMNPKAVLCALKCTTFVNSIIHTNIHKSLSFDVLCLYLKYGHETTEELSDILTLSAPNGDNNSRFRRRWHKKYSFRSIDSDNVKYTPAHREIIQRIYDIRTNYSKCYKIIARNIYAYIIRCRLAQTASAIHFAYIDIKGCRKKMWAKLALTYFIRYFKQRRVILYNLKSGRLLFTASTLLRPEMWRFPCDEEYINARKDFERLSNTPLMNSSRRPFGPVKNINYSSNDFIRNGKYYSYATSYGIHTR